MSASGHALSRTRRVVTGERIFAAAFAAAGLLSIVEGLGYGVIRDDGIIGPGFIPVVVGAILVGLGGGVVWQTFRGPNGPDRVAEAEAAIERELDSAAAPTFDVEGSQRSAALVFAGTFLAIVASNWLGLIISLSLLTAAILLFVERQGVLRSLAIAVAMGAGTWLIFVDFLEVPLGFGIFGQ